MTKPHIVLNSKAMDYLLKQASKPMIEDITRSIEAAAGDGFEGDVRIGRTRVRGVVGTTNETGRKAEAEERTLTRALQAGRR